jgi:hypothetical protein
MMSTALDGSMAAAAAILTNRTQDQVTHSIWFVPTRERHERKETKGARSDSQMRNRSRGDNRLRNTGPVAHFRPRGRRPSAGPHSTLIHIDSLALPISLLGPGRPLPLMSAASLKVRGCRSLVPARSRAHVPTLSSDSGLRRSLERRSPGQNHASRRRLLASHGRTPRPASRDAAL